jgi:hypothetical protein
MGCPGRTDAQTDGRHPSTPHDHERGKLQDVGNALGGNGGKGTRRVRGRGKEKEKEKEKRAEHYYCHFVCECKS